MGFRFRKTIQVGKGFRINLSKGGVGWSASIPGTGISWGVSPRRGRRPKGSGSGCGGCLSLLFLLFIGSCIWSALFAPKSPQKPASIQPEDHAPARPIPEEHREPSPAKEPVPTSPPGAASPTPPIDRTASLAVLKSKLPRRDFQGAEPYLVAHVIDSNTVMLNRGFETFRAHLVGLAAPEELHPGDVGKAQGRRAWGFLRGLLRDQKVYAESDPATPVDRSGLPLVYLHRAADGLFVNLEMLGRGYGFIEDRYPFLSVELFQRFEDDAKANDRGLWGTAAEGAADAPGLTRTAEDEWRHTVELRRSHDAEARERRLRQIRAMQEAAERQADEAAFDSSGSGEKTVHVRGYYRRDGTYVRPHMRRPPRR
jgi:endonuclease YncB( thermonuclease family)